MGTQNFEQLMNLYHSIFVYCGIAALIFLAVAILLFFLLKIPSVFGELTGRNAKRAIEAMTAENAVSGSLTSLNSEDGRRHRRGRTGSLATGRLRKNVSIRPANSGTDEISGSLPTGKIDSQTVDSMAGNGGMQDAVYQNQQDTFGSQPTDVLDTFGSQPTDVLDNYGSQPTDVLDSFVNQPTDQLQQPVNSYEAPSNPVSQQPVYQGASSETMVLNQGMTNQNTFVILRSIVEIHTDEVI